MADRLTCCCRFQTRLVVGLLAGLAVGFVSGLLTGSASAQQTPLADPTQPPTAYARQETAAEPDAVSGPPVLDSILIPKKGRPLAIIGGRQVRLGENYGDSRLIRVTEREAVLEGPEGIEHLFLTPGIEKTLLGTKNETQAPQQARSGSKP